MEEELKELKSVLRSLVVSSPTEVDMRSLMRDYRNMMGGPIPLSKFGYRDPLTFLKEKCSDCFVIRHSGCNPILTVIVTDTIKHIDSFVQRQRSSPMTKFKGKRRSVAESSIKDNLIVKTFKPPDGNSVKNEKSKGAKSSNDYNSNNVAENIDKDKNENLSNNKENTEHTNGGYSSSALQNFMKKRMPLLNSSQYLDSETYEKTSSKGDTDSGRLTSSSSNSVKKARLEELKCEIRKVIAGVPEGVWCTELMKLYREAYGRELSFSSLGFSSVQSLVYSVEGLQVCVAEHTGELLLRVRREHAARDPPPHRPHRPHQQTHQQPAHSTLSTHTGYASMRPVDPDDALPGIKFDEDVFPGDCMHLMQSIPAQDISALWPGAMLEVLVGEVYSPTHFWFLRLGPRHYSAMEDLMDDMNKYYNGDGKDRTLATGAVRVGHYCACRYQGDWHRAVIVKILDSDNVKVRHVDYATVEAVPARGLKPLRLAFARLPVQALRGRLAAVRPPAVGRRWPWAASAHFLSLVRERALVANVVAKDDQERIVEVLLIDTSTEEDVCISAELTRSGYADPRPDSALGTSECYLYPRFDALEEGDTPNYAEIHCYLRDGISLDFVDDYRRHVPPCLPPPAPAPPSPPPPAPATISPVAPALAPAPAAARCTRSLGQLAERPRPARGDRAASIGPVECAGEVSDPAWRKTVGVANRFPPLRPQPPPPPPAFEYFPEPYHPPMYSCDSFPTFCPVAPPRPGFATFFPMPPQTQQNVPPMARNMPPMMPNVPPGGQSILPMRPNMPPMTPNMAPNAPHVAPNVPPMAPNVPSDSSVSYDVPRAAPRHASRADVSAEPSLPSESCVPSGSVAVPAAECEIFVLLSRVDRGVAQRFMMDALRRAMAAATVSGGGAAPRVSAETQTEQAADATASDEPVRLPPGFERFVRPASSEGPQK